jgi:hypothetical protein
MEKILERLKNPLYAGLAGFIAGLIVGLPLLGWLVWPVQWTDAAPQHLRSDLQVEYLRMIIDSYNRNGDEGLVQKRWQDLGVAAKPALEALSANPGTMDPKEIEKIALLVQAPVPAIKPSTKPQEQTQKGKGDAPTTEENKPEAQTEATLLPGTTAETPEKASGSKTNLILLLGVMCVLTLGVGGLLVFLLLRRKKASMEGDEEEGESAEGYTGQDMEYVQEESAGIAESAATGNKKRASVDAEEPPVVQFMTTYMLGDDLYDDSFSIDAPTGEFLGECGVGISETIGVGDPKKVTAFEVWLFDKNDIQTVTKVLMSNHAFNDPNIRQRLLAKGEPQLVEPGKRILLETASLQMEARIVDASYGGGAMPNNSYFDRLTLELAVWPKA